MGGENETGDIQFDPAGASETQSRTVSELEASEARYRTLAESIPQIVWITDANGKFQFWNGRWYDYTGLPRNAGLEAARALVHPDDLAVAGEKWHMSLSAGTMHESEIRLRSRAGEYRWFLVRGTPVVGDDGRPSLIFGTCTDIQDRKAEELDQEFLYRLSEPARGRPASDLLARVVRETGAYLKLSRCLYAEANEEQDLLMMREQFTDGAEPIGELNLKPSDYHQTLRDMVRAGMTIVRSDMEADPISSGPFASPYAQISVRASVVVPVRGHDENEVALFIAQSIYPRRWQQREVALMNTVAERIRLLVDNDRLERAARRGAEMQKRFLREVLESVSDGRLLLVDTDDGLPPALTQYGEVVKLSHDHGPVGIRNLARAAAEDLEFAPDRVFDLMTAVSEAAANAMKHGGGFAEARVGVKHDRVRVTITDWGTGIGMKDIPRATLSRGYSTSATLGHGFKIVLQTVDRIWLRTGPGGTTVVLDQQKVAPTPTWLL
ncbi:MAG: PAS domain S-box protein [Capsulimonadaceae bacterium]